MNQTLSEKILSHKAGHPVSAGDFVVVEPDLVMSHDSLTPGIIKILKEELGLDRVHNPDQLVFVFDHVSPPSTVGTAEAQKEVRRFARKMGIRLFDVGSGICHHLLVEAGLALPGMLITGADSHSTSYGAVGAFGTGMGSTDTALIWATGRTWLRVPETVRIQVKGRFNPGVTPKDLALKLCGLLGIDGASYQTVEYHGLEWLPLEGRQTLASMAVEMGAKAGIIPPAGLPLPVPHWLEVDPGAHYARTVELNLDGLEPQISLPHAVDQVVDLSQAAGQPIDVVFIGTCTNGRYEDLAQVAAILKGRRTAPGLRLYITPASRQELSRAATDGTLQTLIEVGAVLAPPGCGMCMGRHLGTLAPGDTCLSTANRNFKGRMGSPDARIYLASPTVAAATALTGTITDPRNI